MADRIKGTVKIKRIMSANYKLLKDDPDTGNIFEPVCILYGYRGDTSLRDSPVRSSCESCFVPTVLFPHVKGPIARHALTPMRPLLLTQRGRLGGRKWQRRGNGKTVKIKQHYPMFFNQKRKKAKLTKRDGSQN